MTTSTPPRTASACPLLVPRRTSRPDRPPRMKIAPIMIVIMPRMGDFYIEGSSEKQIFGPLASTIVPKRQISCGLGGARLGRSGFVVRGGDRNARRTGNPVHGRIPMVPSRLGAVFGSLVAANLWAITSRRGRRAYGNRSAMPIESKQGRVTDPVYWMSVPVTSTNAPNGTQRRAVTTWWSLYLRCDPADEFGRPRARWRRRRERQRAVPGGIQFTIWICC